MPKVTVRVPHTLDPQAMIEKARQVVEKTVSDFEARDLEFNWNDRQGDFRFKSLAFTIQGRVVIEDASVLVEIDLPLAAMMFKDRVEKAVTKNLTRSIESG